MGLWLLAPAVCQGQEERPRVLRDRDSPSPEPNYRNEPVLAVIRVAFDLPVDPKTLTADRFRLLEPGGKPVPAQVEWEPDGKMAILTPLEPLAARTSYTIDLRFGIRGANGRPSRPYSSFFTTGEPLPPPTPGFAFQAVKIEERNAITVVEMGPDGNLYAADARGLILRHRLDPQTGTSLGTDAPARLESRRISGLAFDPDSTSERLTLWVSHAQAGLGTSTGTVSRLTLGAFGTGAPPKIEDIIVGLPHDEELNHQPGGIAFGPDGKLYQAVSGLTTLGGSPNWGVEETPLSASILVADARSSAFNGGHRPCDVSTDAPNSYDPEQPEAPVKLFATGLRHGYGLCWRSNGQLYVATDQNRMRGDVLTPGRPSAPPVNSLPHEMIAQIQQGKYYGHPNLKRQEYVLCGGNPTSGVDPFEVPEYPVGIRPNRNFDPSLIHDLRASGGLRPGGITECLADGPLKGRLLIAYFSGGKCVQTLAFDDQGQLQDDRPLTDSRDRPLRFSAPSDTAVHPTLGTIYVADYGSPLDGDQGAVWFLSPSE